MTSITAKARFATSSYVFGLLCSSGGTVLWLGEIAERWFGEGTLVDLGVQLRVEVVRFAEVVVVRLAHDGVVTVIKNGIVIQQ